MQKAGDDETQDSCCNLLFHLVKGSSDDCDVDGVMLDGDDDEDCDET